MKEQILLNRPFDAHMHWRQPGLLEQVAPYSMNQFAGGLVMPNTNPKILSLPQLLWYRKAVLGFLKEVQSDFFTLFTYYLSAELSEDDLREAWSQKLIHAVKYYPKGGTTASDKGLTGFREVYPLLAVMEELGIPLLIHGETPEIDGMVVDDFQREQVFMETELVDLVHAFPGLRIVLEHITTEAAANFVLAHANVYATITPQHCLLDRRALFNGISFDERTPYFDLNKNGMHPAMMCRPILKHERDLEGIRSALFYQVNHGLKKFGLGTDTAPHTADKKYCECGACGVFSAPIALELYAMAFEQMGILEHLSVFACEVMPAFYGITDQLPSKQVILEPKFQRVENNYHGIVTPFAGVEIPWTACVQ
jgi:dihydroorotase